jgi:hypothetical protein
VTQPADWGLRFQELAADAGQMYARSLRRYNDLLARVSGHLKPSDIIEEVWVREIVDLIWERLRWRRHQTGLIKGAVAKTLEKTLKPLAPKVTTGAWITRLEAPDPAAKLANEWAAGDPAGIKRVEDLLASAGLTMDDVMARAATYELDKIERFNRLIASAEWRRNALLREIDRRRASFAQKVRSEVREIEDDEYKAIEVSRSGDAVPPPTAAANENKTAPTEDAA